jgi:predicted CoA-substrate-specific enzyme activase
MHRIGVDVGALWTKVVLMDDATLLGSAARRSTMNPAPQVKEMIAELTKGLNFQPSEKNCAATGVGRKNIHGTHQLTDIMAFAKGAKAIHPTSRIVIDMGGQGVRLIELEPDGSMTNFITNDKCSTGTGCFLDIMAAALGVDPAQMGITSMTAKEPAIINTACTVFAESEVVTLVAKKRPKDEIIAGLNDMVAKRVAAMVSRVTTRGDVFLAGGVAMNVGVVKMIEKELHRVLIVPPNANMVGAIGAAHSLGGAK